MSLPSVGLQCIVLGRQYNIEDEAVLDHVAACGYECIECTPRDPVRFKAMLDARGLRHAGMHTSPAGLVDPGALIEKAKALDCHDICSSGLMVWDKRSLADYRAAAGVLNEAGPRLRGEGIGLHYHNHEWEFDVVDGDRTGMDLLFEMLDAEAVDFCADVGWLTRAGLDPGAWLGDHAGRVGYLHLKDFDDEGWCELGEGEVDFAAVVERLPELPNVRWAMIEQDTTRIDPLESVAVSRRNLREKFAL